MPIFIIDGGRALLLIADASSGGGGLYSDWPADWSVCAALRFEFLYGMVLALFKAGSHALLMVKISSFLLKLLVCIMVAAVATEMYGYGYVNPGPQSESPVMTIII
ncbi:hypothetical protein C0J52_10178 [Blattella germanica]|nr:hypothetical protein C0J52_10178 [Blattella germanica]